MIFICYRICEKLMLIGLVYIISASPTPTVPLNDFVKAFTVGKECWHCVDGVFAPHYPLAIRWWPFPTAVHFSIASALLMYSHCLLVLH